MQPKDIALAPIYIYQGRKLKRNALRLPEAQGDRQGVIDLTSAKKPKSSQSLNNFNLMMTGDSSAAGVGVDSQQESLLGHLLSELQSTSEIQNRFDKLDWELHATSGHTSFDVLRRLYVLPNPETELDIMIVMVGVNDTTTRVKLEKWQAQLEEIIALAKRKFGAKYIIFPCLPPMAHMPSIPSPLNTFIGAQSDLMNDKLIEICQSHPNVDTLMVDFSEAGLTTDDMFSEDGFHPNSIAYAFWAKKLAEKIVEVIDEVTDKDNYESIDNDSNDDTNKVIRSNCYE